MFDIWMNIQKFIKIVSYFKQEFRFDELNA